MKKKGLIISTIVMVVVLVASLTTATYAWFSATAQATVENIAVTTEASQGLQVAVKRANDDYIYGDLSINAGTNAWEGTEGWGSTVNFSQLTNYESPGSQNNGSLGVWNSAVTTVTTANQSGLSGKVYSAVSAQDMTTNYVTTDKLNEAAVSAGVSIVEENADTGVFAMRVVTVDDDYSASTNYYIPNTAFVAGNVLLPIGYNDVSGELQPYAYTVATANVNYLDLPISVRTTSNAKAILCSITISPRQGAMSGWTSYAPGMAAASRILVTNGSGQSFMFEPYTDVTLNGQNHYPNGDFTFNFVIAYANGDTNITAEDIYDYKFQIWIEGTDNMCNNSTTGSAFDFNIAYNYIGADETLNPTQGSASLTTNAAAGAAAASTMAAIATTGTIANSGTTYHIGAWTATK